MGSHTFLWAKGHISHIYFFSQLLHQTKREQVSPAATAKELVSQRQELCELCGGRLQHIKLFVCRFEAAETQNSPHQPKHGPETLSSLGRITLDRPSLTQHTHTHTHAEDEESPVLH